MNTPTRIDTSNSNLIIIKEKQKISESSNNNTYTQIIKPKKEKKDTFVFPIALIDEHEEKIREYITIPKNISEKRQKMEYSNMSLTKTIKTKTFSNLKESFKGDLTNLNTSRLKTSRALFNNISVNIEQKSNTFHHSMTATAKKNNFSTSSKAKRPMSVYSKRNDNDVFYLNKAFSDYFKQDFKEFAEKFTLLHPKIKCDKNKMKRALEKVRAMNEENDNALMSRTARKEDIRIDEKQLYLAGNSKNIVPLLKSIYRQKYPDEAEDGDFQNSLKSKGTEKRGVEMAKSIRSMNRIKTNYTMNNQRMNIDSIYQSKISPETYREDDPDLKIFKNKEQIIDLIDNFDIIKYKNTFDSNDIEEDTNMLKTIQPIHKDKLSLPASRPKTAKIDRVFSPLFRNTQNPMKSQIKIEIEKKKQKIKSIHNRQPIEGEQFEILEIYTHNLNSGDSKVDVEKEENESYINNKVVMPTKERPQAQPYNYQIMMKNIKQNTMNENINLFEDILKIENIQTKVVEDPIMSTQRNNESKKQRPFTSINNTTRPFSSMPKNKSI